MVRQLRVGIVGCGHVSTAYVEAIGASPHMTVAGCADVVPERASSLAVRLSLPAADTVAGLLRRPDIDLIANLAVPAAHAEVTLGALAAGKHVYSEKPLAMTATEAETACRLATERERGLGSAPDSFLGQAQQTARAALDDGAIGTPLAAVAFGVNHGNEHWHANPAAFYRAGSGPLFDQGPYYVAALVHLLGPVAHASASARIGTPERIVTGERNRGARIAVETPTHIAGTLEFAAGPIATLVISYDVWHTALPRIEIYGTEGTLLLPDPAGYAGPVKLRRAADAEWTTIAPRHAAHGRGVGLREMAAALAAGRPPRAGGDFAAHALEVLAACHASTERGARCAIASTAARPAPLAADEPI